MGCTWSQTPTEDRPIKGRIDIIRGEKWNFISVNDVDIKATRISDGKEIYKPSDGQGILLLQLVVAEITKENEVLC